MTAAATAALPPPVIERVGNVQVLRDDLLPGGSKRRVLPPLMEEWPEDEFVFGGPAQGYAQVAMAYAAADVGKRATYFVAKRGKLHPLTAEAHEAGAKIVQVPQGRLSVVQHRARAYAAEVGARFLELGFSGTAFEDRLTLVAMGLRIQPHEVWCVAGSGALTRCLQRAWPRARHFAVQIGFPPDVGAATLLQAPEAFHQDARQPPPFPSCANYDAKAWRFVKTRASPGALFWNVGA